MENSAGSLVRCHSIGGGGSLNVYDSGPNDAASSCITQKETCSK